MRRVALIYNPASGQYSARRASHLQGVLAELRKAGIDADALETSAPGSAGALAKLALRNRYDTVIACGGDGTVHEVLQHLVGTDVALGVVPLGTANALAQNLGLGGSPVKAVRQLIAATPTQIPVGRIFYRDSAGTEQSRYFTVAAGIGADALLMSRLDAELKRRLGYALYLVEAFQVWATSPFPLFRAEFVAEGMAERRMEEVSQLLAVRVRSFGGVLRKLAPGATLRNGTLSLVAFKTPQPFPVPEVFAGGDCRSSHIQKQSGTAGSDRRGLPPAKRLARNRVRGSRWGSAGNTAGEARSSDGKAQIVDPAECRALRRNAWLDN